MDSKTVNTTEGIASGAQPEVHAELLAVKAVASLLGGCSTRHVYRLADAGRMPQPIRLGSLVRWRRAELMSWIDAGCPQLRPSTSTAR